MAASRVRMYNARVVWTTLVGGSPLNCGRTLALALFGLGRLPAHAAESFEGKTFYIGDIHAHSGVSGDGASSDIGECTGECGSLEGISAYARAEGLDFLALTDHVNGGMAADPDDFALSLERMALDHDPAGGFVAIPGAELEFYVGDERLMLGHKTLLLFGDVESLDGITIDDVRPGPEAADDLDVCEDLWTWMDGLTEALGPAVLIPHHPALARPMPTDWSCHGPSYTPAVEVYSEHGDSLGLDDSLAVPWSGEHTPGTVLAGLRAHGIQVGFTAGSDNHDTRPGNPCVVDSIRTEPPYGQGFTIAVMNEYVVFDRGTIYTALTDRQTYATSGPMLPIQISWLDQSHDLGGMGAEVVVSLDPTLTAEIRVPDGFAPYVTEVWVHMPEQSLLAVGPGEDSAWSITLDPGEVPIWAFVEVRVDGALWYADTACDEAGVADTEQLWLSPTWFTSSDDVDGDGWSLEEGDCDDYLVTVHPLGLEDCIAAGDEDCNGLADSDDPACAEDTGTTVEGDSGGGGEDSGEDAESDGGPGDDAGAGLDDTAGPAPAGEDAMAGRRPDKAACAGCATLDDPHPIVWWALWMLALARRRP